MSDRARVRELYAEYLTGSLGGAGAAELRRLLEADPAARTEILDDLEVSGMLQELGANAGAEEFRRSIQERLAADDSSTRFLKTLMSGSRLRSRRRAWSRSDGPGLGLPIFLAAAALLIAVAVAVLSSGEAPKPEPRIARPPAPPAPVPPQPPAPIAEPRTPRVPPVGPPRPAPLESRPDDPRYTPPAPAPVRPPAAPAPKPAPRPPSAVAVAEVVSVNGYVETVVAGRTAAAHAGRPVIAGQSIRTVGSGSRAELRFTDGTRIVLEGATTIRSIRADAGKRIVLDRGELFADVRPQPDDRPLVIETDDGAATVLGTTLRVTADPGTTTLEVEKGRVRLTRKSDGASVEVPAGHFSLTAPGPLSVRPLTERPAVTGFTLINVDTGMPVPGFDPIPDNAVLDLSKLPTRRLNIRANTRPQRLGSVRFDLDNGARRHVENGLTQPVYTLAGDRAGGFNAWTPAAGLHTLSAVPYPQAGARGTAGRRLTIRFRVLDPGR